MGQPNRNFMTYFQRLWSVWRQDRLLQAVVKNTGYLFSSNSISMVLTSAQGILAAIVLGPEDWATLGIIIVFASSVNRLLSFRMGELVIKYAGQYLAVGQKDRAAAVIKTAGLTEAITSVVAYLLLLLLSPLAATYIIKIPGTTPWINFYGLALLANLMTETSSSVLQVSNHYRTQAILNLAQSILTAVWILVVFILHGGVYWVLMAYLAGKLIFGIGVMATAIYWVGKLLGPGWLKSPMKLMDHRREMVIFATSTNLSATINMLIRDSEILWIGYFLTRLDVGYYKFAQAVMGVILMPITPFITTTFPEISRSVPLKKWKQLRSLLKRTTLIAAVWTLGCAAGLLVAGQWLLGLMKHGAYLPSFPAIMILMVGYGISNIFFWNRPLCLSFGNPNYPLIVTLVVGTIKTVLMFLIVRQLGYLAQAALLSGYFTLTVIPIVWRGLRHLGKEEKAAVLVGGVA
jgi:O-antigen/teichoic acid export membrane protein